MLQPYRPHTVDPDFECVCCHGEVEEAGDDICYNCKYDCQYDYLYNDGERGTCLFYGPWRMWE